MGGKQPDLVAIYEAYAAAYEEAAADDDWTLVEDFFTDDVVFVSHGEPFANAANGIDEVLGYLHARMEAFGARFDERVIRYRRGPQMQDGCVYLRWVGLYRADGAPTLRLEGSTTVAFRGSKIARVDERISHQSALRVKHWIERYRKRLIPAAGRVVRELLGEAGRKKTD